MVVHWLRLCFQCRWCRFDTYSGTKIPHAASVRFSSFQSLSRVRLFASQRTTACQASLSIINSQSLPKLMSIESVMPSNHLILCRPLLLLPALGSFQMSQLFTSGGQSSGVSVSTSVLPMNTHDYLGREDLFCTVLLCILATSS